ncbi:hypothetical protein PINS_up006079 [Pythium insidiosum]|nr:hypothetical protein PINS_up006079 [Pythium insidiosum]
MHWWQDAAFTELVKANLSGSAQMDVLSASVERKKKTPLTARSGLPTLSMRERMLQMKQQQQAQAQDSSVVVVVAASPAPAPASAPDDQEELQR